jgi:hypothetical protein
MLIKAIAFFINFPFQIILVVLFDTMKFICKNFNELFTSTYIMDSGLVTIVFKNRPNLMKSSAKKIKIEILVMFSALAIIAGNVTAQSVAITVPAGCQAPYYACEGNSFTLAASITGLLPPYKYLWTGGATTSTVTVTTDTTIRVRVKGTNSQGLQQMVYSPWRNFKFLPSPVTHISITGSSSLCTGQTTDLTAVGAVAFSSYLWSNGSTTKTITVSQTGNYSVIVTNPSSCSSASAQQVTVYDPSFIPDFSASGPLTFCKPGSVTLTADPGYTSYRWSTGETTQSITVTLTGSGNLGLDTVGAQVTVEVNNGCSFTSARKIIRSIREPKLMTVFCPKLNLALNRDSIRSEVILPYNSGEVWDYEFEFTETTNLSNVINYTARQTRWCKLSDVTPALEVGKTYNVRVRGSVNGTAYCYGTTCTIGIGSLSSRYVAYNDNNAVQADDGIHFNILYDTYSSTFKTDIPDLDNNPVDLKIVDLAGSTVAAYHIMDSKKNFEFGGNLKAGIYFVQFIRGDIMLQVSKVIKL